MRTREMRALRHNTPKNYTGRDGTPMGAAQTHQWFEAVRSGDEAQVGALLRTHPKLLNVTNADGATALFHAAELGHDKVVACLLASQPDLSVKCGSFHWTPLHIAAMFGNETVVRQLLEVTGAIPSLTRAIDELQRTALHLAIIHSHEQVASIILAADPLLADACDCAHWTALHYAASFGTESIAQELLTLSPDLISSVDNSGNFALHLVSRRCKSKSFIDKLRKLHPTVSCVRNAVGDTPFDIAVMGKNTNAIEVLQWELSLDDMTFALVLIDLPEVVERVHGVIVQQCEELLARMNKDVLCCVLCVCV